MEQLVLQIPSFGIGLVLGWLLCEIFYIKKQNK